MLTKITLTNFKCFQEATEFPLGEINLLTGVNGRGKSTLLQSLLLMRQSIDHNALTREIFLNGSCVRLGSFKDILNTNAGQDEKVIMRYEVKNLLLTNSRKFYYITDVFEYSLNQSLYDDVIAYFILDYSLFIDSNLEYNKQFNKGSNLVSESQFLDLIPQVLSKINKDTFNKLGISGKDYFEFLNLRSKNLSPFKRIHYISADRIGPQDFYLKTGLTDFSNVGAKGENTINLLFKNADQIVSDSLCLGEDAHTLITQTEEWLNYIFDGAKLEIPKGTITVLEPLFNTNRSRDRFKASNVGFGYSYILPIIVSGLIVKYGEILIVENPEAHLHPKAQSRLIKFLAKVSQLGVQIFIESHSDHILNALRIAVLDKIITPEQANILYFPQEVGQPIVQIQIQKDGKIEEWPEGFFDQMDKDFDRLFGV